MRRWIKICTDITDHWLWASSEKLQWWLDLLMLANWESGKVMIGNKVITLERGQLVASVMFLRKRWNRSREMVEAFLKMLENEQMIKKDVANNISIITIVNYDKYQDNATTYLNTQKGTYPTTHLNGSNIESCKDETTHPTTYPTTHPYTTNIEEYRINKKKDISKEISQKEPVDQLQEIMDCFNEMMKDSLIPHPIKGINGTRRGMVLARLKEYGKDAVFDVINKASQSRFLNGDNQRGWIADFNWIFKPNNFIKVSEGNYDNKQALITTTQTQADNGQLQTYNNSGCNQYASDKLARRAEAEAIAMQLIDEGRRRQSEGIPTR